MCAASVAFVVALSLALAFCLTSRAMAATGSGAIAGKVTSASTQAPLAGIEVCASLKGGGEPPVGPEGEEEGGACATSGAGGEYTIPGLANGEYIVSFGPSFLASAESTTNYIPQYYDDKSSPLEADVVSVTEGGTTPGIDAALVEGGRITGRVTDAGTVRSPTPTANTRSPASRPVHTRWGSPRRNSWCSTTTTRPL
jgi:hypothetical protein